MSDIAQALDALYKDNHLWSSRPCETCAAITKATGIPFGCDRRAGRQAPTTTPSTLRELLTEGVALVEQACGHVSHGGPTVQEAEAWLARAKEMLR